MELVKDMIRVYEEYARTNDDNNIIELFNSTPIERKVEAFNIYKKYLDGKSFFLDWGCKHGHAGYMINAYLQKPVEIHGCDIRKGKYSIFSEKANLKYTQLEHYYNKSKEKLDVGSKNWVELT